MNLKNKMLNRIGLAKYHLDNKEYNDSIAVFDTSISTLNVGDEIINDSARKWLREIFPNFQFVNFSTHDGISNVGLNRSSICRHRIICGSNILNSNLVWSKQWNFSLLDFARLEPLTLLGVGWSNYQKKPDLLSTQIYKKRLDVNVIQSVRDNYTECMLQSIGVKNVINTSCPSMWSLNNTHCCSIPSHKGDNVVFTLTDYKTDIEADEFLIEKLKESYNKIYFWVQGIRDLSYFNSLDKKLTEGILVIPPSLAAYDYVLDNEDSLDFVGTRLHAGIRALQKKRRTIIIGIDNRALEKKKDFNISVVSRKETRMDLFSKINSDFDTIINIPERNIEIWKGQF